MGRSGAAPLPVLALWRAQPGLAVPLFRRRKEKSHRVRGSAGFAVLKGGGGLYFSGCCTLAKKFGLSAGNVWGRTGSGGDFRALNRRRWKRTAMRREEGPRDFGP